MLVEAGANVNTPLEAVRVQKKQVETQDIYNSEREHLGDYDRVIEILAER